MDLSVEKNLSTLETTYILKISNYDMVRAEIGKSDFALFGALEDKDSPISDKLHALGNLARKMEQEERKIGPVF